MPKSLGGRQMQITQWHKGTDKPVRDGVYQRLYDEIYNPKIFYCKFAEGKWFNAVDFVFNAANEYGISPFQDEIKWRGVTKP